MLERNTFFLSTICLIFKFYRFVWFTRQIWRRIKLGTRIIHLPIFSTSSIKCTLLSNKKNTFSKTFSFVDDMNSRWRCGNAGRIVNQKLCKLYCYANSVTITVDKRWGLKIDISRRAWNWNSLKVNIGREL